MSDQRRGVQDLCQGRTRQDLNPDDIVVLDNLNSHQGKAVRDLVKAIGARRFFLPSYGPDLNPIDPSAGSGGLRKNQARDAKGYGPKRRSRRKRRCRNPRHHHIPGMLELPRKRRNLNAERSSLLSR
jgi:hypothetical protein